MEHPSDALAALAGMFFELEQSSTLPLEEWLEKATEDLESDVERSAPVEWHLSTPELFALPSLAAVPAWPPPQPTDLGSFSACVAALQSLDRWHRPLNARGTREVEPLLPDHEEAANRLAIADCLGAAELGSIIPGSAWLRPRGLASGQEDALATWHAEDPLTTCERPVLLNALLSETAFLPHAILIEGPNGTGQRPVRMRYVNRPVSGVGRRRFEGPLRVAIAPMAEDKTDIKFTRSDTPMRYGVETSYPVSRLLEVLNIAADEAAEILFVPELCINESQLADLEEAIRTVSRRGLDGEASSLRYVFVGVSGAKADNGFRQNYVAIFDRLGSLILRQDKLYRWNLKPWEQVLFGLDRELGSVTDELLEDIEGASEICVLDLEDLGRVVILICADVNANSPGDWLFTHVRADWIYAPIMDKSTCWTFEKKGLFGRWITRRAHRAACAGYSRVVVTNSVSLTQRVNASNILNGDIRIFEECGVGFLVDGTKGKLAFGHVVVPVSGVSPKVKVVSWGEGWADFPPYL